MDCFACEWTFKYCIQCCTSPKHLLIELVNVFGLFDFDWLCSVLLLAFHWSPLSRSAVVPCCISDVFFTYI